MIGIITNELRSKTMAKRIPEDLIESYNNVVSGEDGLVLEYINILPCDVDIENDVVERVAIDRCASKLSDRDRLIFDMLLNDYTNKEIAEAVGFNRRSISRIKYRIARALIGCW